MSIKVSKRRNDGPRPELMLSASYKKLQSTINEMVVMYYKILVILEIIYCLFCILTDTVRDFSELFDILFGVLGRESALIGLGELSVVWGKKAITAKYTENGCLSTEGQHGLQGLALCRLAVITVIVPYIHVGLPCTYVAPALAIVTSVMFADRRTLDATAKTGIFGLFVGFVMNWLIHPDNLPDRYVINATVALVLLIIIWASCVFLLKAEEGKEHEQRMKVSALKTIEESTEKDALTKLWNIKYIDKTLGSVAYDNLAVAMVDIDDFKKVNDTYGHEFGNVVLVRLANILSKIESDVVDVGRYGGEEFTVIFKNYNITDAQVHDIMNDLRQEFSLQSYRENPTIRITFSCGIATFNSVGYCSNEDILKFADAGLYAVKRTVKNRVLIASEDSLKEELDALHKKIADKQDMLDRFQYEVNEAIANSNSTVRGNDDVEISIADAYEIIRQNSKEIARMNESHARISGDLKAIEKVAAAARSV